MKKIIVISLGGSLIVPDKIDSLFLNKFKNKIRKFYKKYKFIIVCGGGSIARKYISALKIGNADYKNQSLAGIRSTRMNALFLMQLFGKEANDALPSNIKEIENYLPKNSIVICGSLRYSPRATSDSTAAKIAKHFRSEFINMTDVDGLYTKNPKTSKNAKLIKKISWKDFEKKASSIKYHAGQHFVLDQSAAKIIRKNKITTFIIGKNLENLSNLLSEKKFRGTIIHG